MLSLSTAHQSHIPLNICSFVHQCNIHFLIFYYSSTCFGLTRPSSRVIVYSPEAGALLCQFFAYVRVPAMCFCWWCAYCQCPCVRIFVAAMLLVYSQRQRQHKYLTPTISTPSAGAHGWQHHLGKNWHNRAPASGGEYTITPEDGRVRPKHVGD
jgi:hypothetical protein